MAYGDMALVQCVHLGVWAVRDVASRSRAACSVVYPLLVWLRGRAA